MSMIVAKLRRTRPLPLIAAITLVALASAISCAGKQTPRDRITDLGELLFNGDVVSSIDCYKCHNGDGTGTWRGANLGQRVPKMTDPAIAKAILEGPGMMKSYKGKIDGGQIAQITAWLRVRFPYAK